MTAFQRIGIIGLIVFTASVALAVTGGTRTQRWANKTATIAIFVFACACILDLLRDW